MPNQVTITNVFGLTPPFSAYCCNVYGNQCVYVGSGVMPPITITLPPQFNTAPAVGLLLIDSIGCERFEEIYCTPPTPSPTQTPTPTTTPTPTPTSESFSYYLSGCCAGVTLEITSNSSLPLPTGDIVYYVVWDNNTQSSCFTVVSPQIGYPSYVWNPINDFITGPYIDCDVCYNDHVVVCPTPTPTPTPTETPTPTPTPTPIPCDTYWLFDGGFAGATFDYTDCDGFLQILFVGIGSFEYRCGYLLPDPTLISGSGTFSDSGPCPP